MCVARRHARTVAMVLLGTSLASIFLNLLLFFPGGKVLDRRLISHQVWLMGGIIGGGLLVMVPSILSLKAVECFGEGGCDSRYQMLASAVSSAVGALGAVYSVAVSLKALTVGPICRVFFNTWAYPFQKSNDGMYIIQPDLWKKCLYPESVVIWHIMLFFILLFIGFLQSVLCTIQTVIGTLGYFCGHSSKD